MSHQPRAAGGEFLGSRLLGRNFTCGPELLAPGEADGIVQLLEGIAVRLGRATDDRQTLYLIHGWAQVGSDLTRRLDRAQDQAQDRGAT